MIMCHTLILTYELHLNNKKNKFSLINTYALKNCYVIAGTYDCEGIRYGFPCKGWVILVSCLSCASGLRGLAQQCRCRLNLVGHFVEFDYAVEEGATSTNYSADLFGGEVC